MTHLNKTPAILIGALVAVAWPAYGDQPPNVVVSDDQTNTAMGSFALQSNTDLACCNTAAGFKALLQNTEGDSNSAFGSFALVNNTTGRANTAVGHTALDLNTTGGGNVAVGFEALFSNITGESNVAVGGGALGSNLNGNNNTAVGSFALGANGGNNNTASGFRALLWNDSGEKNTATGFDALRSNTTGGSNTASGAEALLSNTAGYKNTADGGNALRSNTTGNRNTAAGMQALSANTTGARNTATGMSALGTSTTGSDNIALGYHAGYAVIGGGNNIEIGNQGLVTDQRTIRIGTAGTQSATYIAGISGARVTGSAVYITSNGKLGVLASSERYKTDVAPMASNSAKLEQLRPVTFHLKTDPRGALQYGLIAEEVSKVYPELVIRDSAGSIEGVRYEELTPMLLNEVQQQQREIDSLQHQVAEMMDLNRSMQAALLELQTRKDRVGRQ